MKFKIGSLYEIIFWDHCTGQDAEPIKFAACGYVLKDDKQSVVFTTWFSLNTDKESFNKNVETFCILKNCIISRKKFESGKEKKGFKS